MVDEGWFSVGKTLGVAADLDAGTLFFASDGGPWTTSFTSGVAPGPEVGPALFPALSGSGDARVRCNFGTDASQPLRHAPPSDDYRPFGAAAAAVRGEAGQARDFLPTDLYPPPT